jgi:hypothetical protein
MPYEQSSLDDEIRACHKRATQSYDAAAKAFAQLEVRDPASTSIVQMLLGAGEEVAELRLRLESIEAKLDVLLRQAGANGSAASA